MTRGAQPQYAETPYAQWLRQRLEELGWQKQDLADRLAAASKGRLGTSGAAKVVHRVSYDQKINAVNQALLDQILGSPAEEAVVEAQKVSDRLAALEAQVEKQGKATTSALRGVTNRLTKIEEGLARLEPPRSRRAPRASEG